METWWRTNKRSEESSRDFSQPSTTSWKIDFDVYTMKEDCVSSESPSSVARAKA